jgi:hypothetical protein
VILNFCPAFNGLGSNCHFGGLFFDDLPIYIFRFGYFNLRRGYSLRVRVNHAPQSVGHGLILLARLW